MEEYKIKLITLLIGLSLLALNWFIDFLAGFLKAKKVNKLNFSWKKMLGDLAKAITFGLITILLSADYELLSWFISRCGLDIKEFGDVLSTSAIALMLIWRSVQYMFNATGNYKEYLNYKDDIKELIDKSHVDFHGIYEDFTEAIKVNDKDELVEDKKK